jgi:hypothetical protein
MRWILKYVLLLLAIAPIAYWFGYDQGAIHQQSLDAPAKALLISKIAELYEEGDSRAHTLMYTYLDTELSFYEDYLENGLPLVAKLTAHGEYLTKDDEYLSKVAVFIHSTNDGTNKYKQDVADRLERIGYKSHNNAPNPTQ